MLVSSRQFLLGSALLLAALPVLGGEESGSVAAPVSSLPHGSINCPGISSVPVTADAEQALPMHLVASLSCGEKVTVLSDSEGYTVWIRTTAGTEGYVARMFLVHESDAPVAREPQTTSATPVNGVVRWEAGAPGCDQFLTAGRHVESVTANGVTVQISLHDTGWKFRTNISVSNHRDSSVDVIPTLVTLEVLKPGLKPLLPQDPSKLRHATNHQVFRSAATAQPSPSAVAQNSGQMPVMSALVYRSPAASNYTGQNAVTGSGSKLTATEVDATAVDAMDVEALSLKAASLAAGQQTSGAVWFQRESNARELSLRLVVGDLIFDFPLSFDQKK